jgi:hypothetical protein
LFLISENSQNRTHDIMLNTIANNLHYFGLERAVDASSGRVMWASTVRLGERTIFYGSGAMPGAALDSMMASVLRELEVVDGAVDDWESLKLRANLDRIADYLLRLVITPLQVEDRSGVRWQGEARFRQRRAFWLFGPRLGPQTIRADGSSPDEVLEQIIRQTAGH